MPLDNSTDLLSTIVPYLAIIAMLPAQALTQTVSSGAIAGSVVDDSGAPIANAVVAYHNSPKRQWTATGALRPVELQVVSSVQTSKDGTFSITGLPPSHYFLCAAGIKPTHLRSCDWGKFSTHVDLTSLPAVSGVKLQVSDGVFLTFMVTDAQGRIQDYPNTPGKVAVPGNFRIFAVQGTHFMAAQPLSVSGAVRQYGLAVPKTGTVRVHLDTALNVVDQAGASVAVRQPTNPIEIAGQAATVSFSVP